MELDTTVCNINRQCTHGHARATHTHTHTLYVQTVAEPNHKLEQNTPTFRVVLLILGPNTATPNN